MTWPPVPKDIDSLDVNNPFGVDNIIKDDLKTFLVKTSALILIKKFFDWDETSWIFLKNGEFL